MFLSAPSQLVVHSQRLKDGCAGALHEVEGPQSTVGAHERAKLLERYVATWPLLKGWMAGIHTAVVKTVSDKQKALGIVGSIGEIGLHHGKFFLSLLLDKAAEEDAVGIDLFDLQSRNFDKSGRGRQRQVYINAGRVGLNRTKFKLLSSDSTLLEVHDFQAMNLSAFRLFSIDGGHSYETTLKDLRLARCMLREGGVIVLDDFINEGWMGVVDAAFHFIRMQTDVRPFLWLCSKLYFTTVGSHKTMLQLIQSMPCISCTSSEGLHNSRFTIGSFPLCVARGGCAMSAKESIGSCFKKSMEF